MHVLRWQGAVLLGVTAFLAACGGRKSSAPEETALEAEFAAVVAEEVAAVETAVSAPTPTQEISRVNLDDLGPAPEIKNEIWLNTDEPLPLSTQRGKVVLLEFWTFG